MSERGELHIRIEDIGSRWRVMARWTLWENNRPEHATDFCIGIGQTKEEALQIAGLFGAATGYAVTGLAKYKEGLLADQGSGGVFTAAGIATLRDVDQGRGGSLSYRGDQAPYYSARPGSPQQMGQAFTALDAHRERLAYEALQAGQIDYRGGMVTNPQDWTYREPAHDPKPVSPVDFVHNQAMRMQAATFGLTPDQDRHQRDRYPHVAESVYRCAECFPEDRGIAGPPPTDGWEEYTKHEAPAADPKACTCSAKGACSNCR